MIQSSFAKKGVQEGILYISNLFTIYSFLRLRYKTEQQMKETVMKRFRYMSKMCH